MFFSCQVWKKLGSKEKKVALFAVWKYIVIAKKYVLISMQLFSVKFFMLSAKTYLN